MEQLPDWAEKFLVEHAHHCRAAHFKALVNDAFNELRIILPPGCEIEVSPKETGGRKW